MKKPGAWVCLVSDDGIVLQRLYRVNGSQAAAVMRAAGTVLTSARDIAALKNGFLGLVGAVGQIKETWGSKSKKLPRK